MNEHLERGPGAAGRHAIIAEKASSGLDPVLPRRGKMPVGGMLVFAFLTPLIPRPTVDGPIALIAPAAIAGLVIAFAVVLVTDTTPRQSSRRPLTGLIFLLLIPTLVYGARILLESQWSELSYFGAKIAMSLGILVVFLWLDRSAISVKRVYAAVCAGYFALAPLMIYVGVTGNGVLEAARPSREYGFSFYKAAGVPRSYGELAIFSAIVLAYLLVYRSSIKRSTWSVAIAVWVITLFVAQSRTGFIAAAVVLFSYLALRLVQHRRTGTVILLTVISVPFLAQFVFPALQNEELVADVVGQSTYQNNVTVRLDLYGLALSRLVHPTFSLLVIGIDRDTWLASTVQALGDEVVIHNFYLSTLMFYGVIAGSVTIIGLLIRPAMRLTAALTSSNDRLMVFVATAGMLTAIQFYESFFSLIVLLQIAVLWYAAHSAAGAVRNQGRAVDPTRRTRPGSSRLLAK